MLCLALSGIFLPYSSGVTNDTAILGAGVDLEGKGGGAEPGVYTYPQPTHFVKRGGHENYGHDHTR